MYKILAQPWPVRSSAVVGGPQWIMALHGKQELVLKDNKQKCSSYSKTAIPRISILLACCWVFSTEKYTPRLVTAGVSPHTDGRYLVTAQFSLKLRELRLLYREIGTTLLRFIMNNTLCQDFLEIF
jgi:hypothetical protein